MSFLVSRWSFLPHLCVQADTAFDGSTWEICPNVSAFSPKWFPEFPLWACLPVNVFVIPLSNLRLSIFCFLFFPFCYKEHSICYLVFSPVCSPKWLDRLSVNKVSFPLTSDSLWEIHKRVELRTTLKQTAHPQTHMHPCPEEQYGNIRPFSLPMLRPGALAVCFA